MQIGARTTQKHFGYGVSWPITGTPAPSSASAKCTTSVKVCRGTTPRRTGGIERPPTKDFDYAQFNLGVAYEDGGLGVPQDYALAYMWFNLASSPATNTDLRQMAVENRDKVAAKMTPAQIAEAQRMAREWKPK